jgi:hypothetical protein
MICKILRISYFNSVSDPRRGFYPGFRIRNFVIADPGSESFPSRIRIKKSKYFSPKMVSKLSEIRIRLYVPEPDPDFLPIPDSGVKNSPDPDPQHSILNCLFLAA